MVGRMPTSFHRRETPMQSTAKQAPGQDIQRAAHENIVAANAFTEIDDMLAGYFVLHQAVNEAVEGKQERAQAEHALFTLLETIHQKVKAALAKCDETGERLAEAAGLNPLGETKEDSIAAALRERHDLTREQLERLWDDLERACGIPMIVAARFTATVRG
jgi:hypothetical protein